MFYNDIIKKTLRRGLVCLISNKATLFIVFKISLFSFLDISNRFVKNEPYMSI